MVRPLSNFLSTSIPLSHNSQAMNTLVLDHTPKTPQILFDHKTGKLQLSGRSIPENAHRFYLPLLEWLDEYLPTPADQTHFVLNLTYFNSSSAEFLLDIFKKLEDLYHRGKAVHIHWHYDNQDEDMLMVGEDFKQLLKVPITMIAVAEDE